MQAVYWYTVLLLQSTLYLVSFSLLDNFNILIGFVGAMLLFTLQT